MHIIFKLFRDHEGGSRGKRAVRTASRFMADKPDTDSANSLPDMSVLKPHGEALIVSDSRPGHKLLIASTIDGSLHAIDRVTGRLVWSCSDLGGSLLKGTGLLSGSSDNDADRWALSSEPNFLIEPMFPGSLYIYVPGDILQVNSLAYLIRSSRI